MSASKKSSKKLAPVSTPPASVASVNPIPTSVSAPPEHWVAPAKLGKRGSRPRNGLNLVAPDLAAELRKNAAALSEELGPKAVDPQQLAAALDSACGWEGVEKKASTFHVYARAQRGASWDAAMKLMAGMKLGVRFAVHRDATFADRFPGVAKAFAPTRRANAKKGASTKGTKGTKRKSTPAATEPAPVAPAMATA